MKTTEYKHTPDMGEISGFGNGYEATCQDMLNAGVHWLNEHPNADPKFLGYTNVTGICLEDNQDAKNLTKAVIDGAGEYGATGAMHHHVIARVLKIKEKGWEWYCAELRKHHAEEANSVPSA